MHYLQPIFTYLHSLFTTWRWLLPRIMTTVFNHLGILAVFSGLFLFVGNYQPTLAQVPTPNPAQLLFADDFEHGLDKWQVASGSWQDWNLTDEGWLEANLDSSYSKTELVPADGYWQNDWLNYQFEFDFTTTSSADYNWGWGYEDEDNWYEIHFYAGIFHIARVRDGRALYDLDGAYSIRANHIYHVKIIFNQGRIQIWVNDEQIADRQDYTYQDNGGKITLKASTGADYPTHVSFDNIRVYSLEDTGASHLPLKQFRQYQLPWRDYEYDHASDWSSREQWPEADQDKITIRDWGCALTSLTSLFHYYDLKTLPDTTDLNPGTFNDWLRTQSDGYLGEGLLNWLAATRLSRLIHDKYSTSQQPLPKLECQRDFTPTTDEIVSHIDDHRPQIIQIPGHFFLAHGYWPQEESSPEQDAELLISDPAYSYTRFSQHQAVMSSSLDFQPSQTDLSYLLAVYDPSINFVFTDDSGQTLTNSFLARDTLANQFYDYQTNQESSLAALHQAPVTHYLAKPATGDYQLQVVANEENEDQQPIIPIQVLAYDQFANATLADWYLVLDEANQQPQTAQLAYSKEAEGDSYLTMAVQPDFDCLETVVLADQSLPAWLQVRLEELVVFAMDNHNATNWARQRYQQLLLNILHDQQQAVSQQFLQAAVSCLN